MVQWEKRSSSLRIPLNFNRYVDGATHWVQVDGCEDVNKHIREFLNVHPQESLQKPD